MPWTFSFVDMNLIEKAAVCADVGAFGLKVIPDNRAHSNIAVHLIGGGH